MVRRNQTLYEGRLENNEHLLANRQRKEAASSNQQEIKVQV